MYYSAAEQRPPCQAAGCGMNSGELLASVRISGPDESEYGSLMELKLAGRDPSRSIRRDPHFIEDNDTLILRRCRKGRRYQIGFGTCERHDNVPPLNSPT